MHSLTRLDNDDPRQDTLITRTIPYGVDYRLIQTGKYVHTRELHALEGTIKPDGESVTLNRYFEQVGFRFSNTKYELLTF